MIYDESESSCLENIYIFRAAVFSLSSVWRGEGLYYNRNLIFLNGRDK